MNIIDFKLINAYSVLCYFNDDREKTIEEIIEETKVPISYREEVAKNIANRRIEVLKGEINGLQR